MADDDEPTPDQSRHERYMREFDSAYTPATMERARMLQCRRFANLPGAMWEGDQWADFGLNMIRVEVNKVRRGAKKVKNDYRANRVMVDFRPVDDGNGPTPDEETADTLDGLYRADVYRSAAGEAFDNAFGEGIDGGMGAFRICNDLEDEYDPDNDNQVINFELIPDADQSVFWDPNSKRYDKADAKWCYVITSVARATFDDEWGSDRATSFPFTWKPYYQWFQPDMVRIAERYGIIEERQTRVLLSNAITGEEKRIWKSDVSDEWLKDQRAQGWKTTSRDVPRRRVQKEVLSGAEILKDCGLIAGSMIPVICFYAERFYIDNQERAIGHTQDAMDSNRIYNTIVSSLMETTSSSPNEVPVWYPEQIAGHADDWARAQRDRLAYLQINPMYDENGALLPMQGPVYKTTPPALPPQIAALLQVASNDIAELTNAEDGADQAMSNVSHDAMDLAATRTDEKSFGYMDNWRLSVEWSGRVYMGMAIETYVEEGRKLPTRGVDGEQASATLLQPKMDKGRYLTINDFASGKFNVIADVTESSATKRDKTVRRALGVAQIAGSNGSTDLANAALLTAVVNMDGDGMDDFKKYARKAALQIGLVEPTDEEKQEMEQAAQQQQGQPDPAQIALMAQAKKLNSDAGLADAKANTEQANAIDKMADAHLKVAQAGAVGGPVSAPEAPTGLEAPQGIADVADKFAGARLKNAQAEHLTEQIHDKRIRRGTDADQWQAEHALEHRKQDHVETQTD